MKLYVNWYELYENYIELSLASDNYLNDSDFLLLFFVIYIDLQSIMVIICQRKYEPLNNLK